MTTDAPLRTTEAAEAIATFLGEFFPILRDLQALSIDVCSFRLGFCNSFYSPTLKSLEQRHIALMGRFMSRYRTWCDANELFKGFKDTDLQKAARMVADYNSMKGAIREHLDEGFLLISHIDRVISDRKTTVYNRLTLVIALLAVVISVFVAK